jgi:hypothetical protein
MDTVLFACVHNAGRSQMAAAWFNKLCDLAKAPAIYPPWPKRGSLNSMTPFVEPAMSQPRIVSQAISLNPARSRK